MKLHKKISWIVINYISSGNSGVSGPWSGNTPFATPRNPTHVNFFPSSTCQYFPSVVTSPPIPYLRDTPPPTYVKKV